MEDKEFFDLCDKLDEIQKECFGARSLPNERNVYDRLSKERLNEYLNLFDKWIHDPRGRQSWLKLLADTYAKIAANGLMLVRPAWTLMSISEYSKLLIDQRFCCGICKRPAKISDLKNGGSNLLVPDHDHKLGKMRGLLCKKCNMALGLLKDNPSIVSNAASYLSKYSEETQSNNFDAEMVSIGWDTYSPS